jgi:hypothetical protein
MRSLAVGVCVAWASTALAQSDLSPQRPQPPAGAPYSSDEAPRPGDPLPPKSTERRDSRGEVRSNDRWGAVAYTADGAFGAAYGIDNKADAERLAIDECQRESTDRQDCARGVVTRQDSWFHIQFCQRGTEHSTHVTTRPTLAETNQAAAEFARTQQLGPNACRMVPNGLFHSGGMHTRM